MCSNPPAEPSEDERRRRLRTLVDVTAALLRRLDFSLDEALLLIADTRSRALELFPSHARTYDLIYGARFSRILEERFGEKWQNHPRRMTVDAFREHGE